MRRSAKSFVTTLALVLLVACEQESTSTATAPASSPTVRSGAAPAGSSSSACVLSVDPGASERKSVSQAITMLQPTKGNKATGSVRFEAVPEGVKVRAELSDLSPGTHAFHVHVLGNCSAPDAKSAGPHFDFEGSALHPPPDIDHITGDLGELTADASGKARFEGTIAKASLTGPFTIVGRSVVVHAKPNDPSKPPDGAAGARVACGVIGVDDADVATE
jgi:superoxide dismutase, Cu-Zn family